MFFHEWLFFGIHRVLRTGTVEAWNEMLAAENMTHDELAALRDAKVGAVWELLKYSSPWFCERLPPESILDQDGRIRTDVWARAPVTSREDVRSNLTTMAAFDSADARSAFENDGTLPHGWSVQKSGGSTGQPVEYLQDKRWKAWNRSAAMWCDRMSGAWPCREKRLKIWGGTQEISGGHVPFATRVSSWLQQGEILPSFRMDEASMRSHVETINRRTDVHTLEGYVSTLFTLAEFAERAGLTIRPVRRVISSAGNLYPHMKELMERAFGAPVFNRYGSRDGGATANQCELRRGLHVCETSLYVEIVDEDGIPVPDGTPGEILLTQLENGAQPLFRYRIGDRGVIDPEPCTCGRPHRMLSRILGRVTEQIRTPDGRVLDSLYFVHLIGVALNTGWIDRFQIRQEVLNEVVLLLAPRSEADPTSIDAGIDAVTSELKTSFGPRMKLDVRLVDDIPPAPSGKHLYVVSKLSHSRCA